MERVRVLKKHMLCVHRVVAIYLHPIHLQSSAEDRDLLIKEQETLRSVSYQRQPKLSLLSLLGEGRTGGTL